jgi:predicted PurR-regulated permease PerM
LIAFCNALLTFLALTVLGVEHAVLLALAVFVLCQVPTLGMCLSWALLVAMALLQPGGGLILALKVSGAVVVIILLETFVISPRILGRMMELHPVLLLAVLPLAQYFFGIWGLLLATPIAVYVVHVLILRRGLPGIDAPREAEKVTPPAGAEPETTQLAALAEK